jgi:hypothetical protein
MRYEHPLLAFTLELPEGWRVVSEVPPTFVAPDAAERRFAPNVVVTAGERDRAAHVIGALAGGVLLDDHDGRALIVHAERDVPTVLEQWWLERDGRALALSASCDPLDYDELADAFEDAASTFRPS